MADADLPDGDLPDVSVPDDGSTSSRIDALLAQVLAPGRTAESNAALLHEVAWADGWPVRETDRWLFMTRWETDAEVSLVGDFNAWAPGAAVAERSADGVHLVVVIDAPGDGRGLKYKWWASDEFRAPPESTAYGYDDFGPFGWVAPPRDQPWLERYPDLSTIAMPVPRTVRVRLPAGFEPGTAARSLRTVLFHDGQNVLHPDAPHGGWRAGEALDAFGPTLAIGVDNASDRIEAYTHVADAPPGVSTESGGRADVYLGLVEDTILPFIRGRFGVEAEGASLAVAGASLGGLVALHQSLSRPELAGCVIAMSSTLGWGAYGMGDGREALVHRWMARGGVSIYLDSGGAVAGTCADGDGDGVVEDSDDTDNYCATIQLRDHLESLGYMHGVDLAHWWEPGALHNESAWAARLPRALAACGSMGWSAP
jgi:predicted alpha/beta superfamily hydrolase